MGTPRGAAERSAGENSNQMRSSHSPGIKTSFHVIFLTFLSAQRGFLCNKLRLSSFLTSDMFLSAWTSCWEGLNIIAALVNRADVRGGGIFWEWWKNAEAVHLLSSHPLHPGQRAGIASPVR